MSRSRTVQLGVGAAALAVLAGAGVGFARTPATQLPTVTVHLSPT